MQLTCSWCYETVTVPAGHRAWCRCGHEAGMPRLFCECARCQPAKAPALRAALEALAKGLDDYLQRGRCDDGGALSRLRDEAILALERAGH
jgi:hypothetical protein